MLSLGHLVKILIHWVDLLTTVYSLLAKPLAWMTGMREAVRIMDILTTGNDFTAEVEAIAAAKRHSDSERSEVILIRAH